MPVSGRVFPERSAQAFLVNLSSGLFSDVLSLVLSGRLVTCELATDELQRGRGRLVYASFDSGLKIGNTIYGKVGKQRKEMSGAASFPRLGRAKRGRRGKEAAAGASA
jgi:hypothetical protein